MARWFSPADAAACVAAGVGAWFTRASLDVFAVPGGDARIAMLPAPVELPGLVTLACLSAFLLRAIIGRSPRGSTSTSGTSGSSACLLLPLLSVLAVAVPYAPWLPDLVPAWRALAGPARFALWAIVCGQVAWIAIDRARRIPASSGRQTILPRNQPDAPAILQGHWHPTAAVAPAARIRANPPAPRPLPFEPAPAFRESVRHDWPALIVFVVSLCEGAAVTGHVTLDAFGPAGASFAHISPALRVSLGAVVSTLLWLWAERVAGSRALAAMAWLAIVGAAPFVLSVIFMPGACAAALCVVLATGWPGGAGDRRTWAAAVRGSALAVLVLLDAAFLPLAIVLLACLVWRMRDTGHASAAACAPLALAAIAAPAFHPAAWRALIASHGAVFWPAVALFTDQQQGVLLYAPALALAAPGLWWLWRDGGAARFAAVEAVAGTAALLLTAGWQRAALGVVIPGAHLLPALPLFIAPIARWLRHNGQEIAGVAVARWLVLWGVIASAMLLGRGGAALLRGRDGASALLEWLAPSRDLVRVAPFAPVPGADPFGYVVSTLIWVATIAVLGWVIARTRPASHGSAGVIVTIGALIALAAGTAGVDAALGPRLPARVPPVLRVDARMLDAFDARARPLAVAYDPWRTLPPAGVPSLFSFDATPGARRFPQPMRVLLNTRLSLPAGDYVVTLRPAPGAALNGNVGLQVGRMGPAMREWTMASVAGAPWTASFTLPVDASFVGFRAAPDVESNVAALRIQPARVVDGRDRPNLPTVLSAATYKDVIVTFHGNQVYAERDGFWVRGRSTLLATFAPPDAPGRAPGVRLSLHGGDTPNRVRFETSTWGTTIALAPGVPREVLVPALQGQPLLPVRITAESGFVPADTLGGSDRRVLGCWIEVLE
jgi:hypothetical protein